MKTSQNTPIDEIDIISNPNTETMLFRYLVAGHWCKGKRVADVACGYGYGAPLLISLGATSVEGYDIDKDAIHYAETNYMYEKNNDCPIFFYQSDILKEGPNYNEDEAVDTVISIETFEHLPKDKIHIYLQNLAKMVKNGGHIFITTPLRTTPTFKYDGGTHLYEYSADEFMETIQENIPGEYQFFGIQEQRVGEYNQLISILTNDITNCRVQCAVIQVEKNE